MTEADWQDDEEVSLFALGATLLRNRWRILLCTVAGGLIAVLPVLRQPLSYSASASFITQGGGESGRSGIAGLAGQLGVALPQGNLSQTPEFYQRLLKSRELLAPITRDTFVVAEMNGRRVPFIDLFGLRDEPPKKAQEDGVEIIAVRTSVKVTPTTGLVELSVTTLWPSVSLAVASALIQGVNDFNSRTRQSQAAAERKFVEARLATARAELRTSEDRLEQFLRTNKDASAPSLFIERGRLERDVQLQQQVYTLLSESYEDARLREVRDIPVITVVESPAVPSRPVPRGRITRGTMGAVFGAVFGIVWSLLLNTMRRRRAAGDPDANAFVGALADMKSEMLGGFRRARRGTPVEEDGRETKSSNVQL